MGVNTILFQKVRAIYLDSYVIEAPSNSKFLFADSHGNPLSDYLRTGDFFNFSASSDSYLDIEKKINHLLRKEIRIDTIFLSVDRHTLSEYRLRLNNLDRSIFYDKLQLNHQIMDRYLVFTNESYIGILKRYLSGLTIKESSQGVLVNTKSWVGYSIDKRQTLARERAVVQYDDSLSKSEDVSAALLRIIALCKANGIALIGIKFPLTKEYLLAIGDKNYGADSLLLKSGFSIWDYSTLYEDDPSLFVDQDHLSELGGRRFAKELLQRID